MINIIVVDNDGGGDLSYLIMSKISCVYLFQAQWRKIRVDLDRMRWRSRRSSISICYQESGDMDPELD